ncbi:MAG: hypothetical protein AABY22_09595, partial [Nanoarchaeota archaeon]
KNIVYFHATPQTKQFLEEVGVVFAKRIQLIKYLKNDILTQDITTNDKILMIRKKLNNPEFIPVDLNLSTNDYFITIYEFDVKLLIDKIKEKVTVIKEKVIRITNSEIITEQTSREYSHIISTIAAPLFWKLYYKSKNLKFESSPVTFVLTDKEIPEAAGQIYDLVYIMGDKYKFTRISKKPSTRESNLLLYEFTGNLSKEDVIKYLPEGANILDYYVDYQGVIISNACNIAPPKILFSGRFAEFSHHLKQQDVIMQATWSSDLRHIWNRQKSFMANRLDFNLFNTDEEKEKETQTILFHTYNELAEVSREINYKLHKKRHSIDVDRIKNELIDVQKYLLNLFIIWGVDSKEFIELFDAKSKLVEELYELEFKK